MSLKSSAARTILTVALGMSAALGHADAFSVVEGGTWTSSLPVIMINSSLLIELSNTTWVTTLGSADLQLSLAGSPSPFGTAFTGTLDVSAGAGFTGALDFNVTGKLYTGATESIAGSATLAGVSGSFIPYNTGIANFAYQLVTAGTAKIAVGTVSAQVESVPEPTMPLMVGLGFLSLASRRRSA